MFPRCQNTQKTLPEEDTALKIKIKEHKYEDVRDLPMPMHREPHKQSFFFRLLLRLVSLPDILATHFSCTRVGMERLKKREPALFLMNHSSFVDLEIASTVLFPRRFGIVCTTDAMVGKNWLMRQLGCIPTNKFVSDVRLLHDMHYAAEKLKSSVLMFPEAGYTLDGRATPLPENFGKCIKMLGLPVVMITTEGAFLRDPLYNNLQRRRVKVSAEMRYLLSPEEIAEKSAEELGETVRAQFDFDAFRLQQQRHIKVDEPFRADYLHRILYKCPACRAEEKMHGEGTRITCRACGKSYFLDEYGSLVAEEGATEFPHIPDWVDWERECVREEIEAGTYAPKEEVDICMLVNSACLFRVGEGRLTHGADGFALDGCDGELHYHQGPLASHTLNADFNWYEIGDVIGIGNRVALYYCFPKRKEASVFKFRLATEEIYKITRDKKTSAAAAAIMA